MRKINPDVKIIIVSVVEKVETDKELREQKIEGYITKPFDIHTIRKLVTEVLGL